MSADNEPMKINLSVLKPMHQKIVKLLASGRTPQQVAEEFNVRVNTIYAVLANIRGKMVELLDGHGLTDMAIIEQYLKPALDAEDVEYAQKDGKFTDSVKKPNWGARVRALDNLAKMKGLYAESNYREPASGPNVAVQVNLAINRPKRNLPVEKALPKPK